MEVVAELPALLTIANSYKKLKFKTFRGAKFVQEVKRNKPLQDEFIEVVDLAKVSARDEQCGLPGSPTIVSMTWKIGTVGGNCTMHQGKSAEELVGAVLAKESSHIAEFVKR